MIASTGQAAQSNSMNDTKQQHGTKSNTLASYNMNGTKPNNIHDIKFSSLDNVRFTDDLYEL